MARRDDDQQKNARGLLYQARRRTPSPSPLRPGKCMTRIELADAVNVAMRELYPDHKGLAAFYVNDRWIGNLERGDRHWAGDIRRAALRHAVSAGTDAEIGLYPPLSAALDLALIADEQTGPPDSTPGVSYGETCGHVELVSQQPGSRLVPPATGSNSRTTVEPTVMRAATPLTKFVPKRRSRSPFDGLAELSIESPAPATIGWNDVDHVRFITRALALSENTYGGGFSGQAAAAQLRHSARLIEAQASTEVRRTMHEAVGNLSGVVGFCAFDVDDHQSASVCFDFALWCAEEADSWPLRANALSDMARLAMYLKDYDEALSLIEFAQVRSDRLAATTCAMLSAVRARLLALQHRDNEVPAELARSDDYFAARNVADDPPWVSYYDEAEHQGSTGRALIPIAVRNRDPELAAPRLHQAVLLHDDQHPRSRVFSRTRLACLMMRVGDPREAASIGQTVLAEASMVRSTRLRTELEHLASLTAAHANIPEVARLRREITESRHRIGAY